MPRRVFNDGPHHVGWARDWDEMQNDSGDTINRKGEESMGFGDPLDEAFRRGREYATKGYSLATTKNASKKRGKPYVTEMVRGWKWQAARAKKV